MIDQLASRVRKLESAEDPVVFNSVAATVSTPPTQVEIDTAFGATAAEVRDGWSGLIYDNAGAGTIWVCISRSDVWWVLKAVSTVGSPFYWEDTGIGAVAVTIIPNGAGDITKVMTCMYVIAEETGAGVASGNCSLVPGVNFNLYADGTDTLQLQCSALGALTIQRTAGADTFTAHLWLIWI